jgi:hypothetical protein
MKWLIAVGLAALSACSSIPVALAPGAEQVRVTNVAGDVADCAPVGNLQVQWTSEGMLAGGTRIVQIRNQTIGFAGNAAFVTDGDLAYPEAGVAYRCPNQSRPADPSPAFATPPS